MRQKEYLQRKENAWIEETGKREQPSRTKVLLKEIGKGKRVLDLGCGSGKVSELIKNQNNEVFGVEINKIAADRALDRGIRVKVFDIADGLPFEDSFFDVVAAGSVVESLFDTKYLFEESNRVLKSGGLFILHIRNLNSLGNRFRVLKGDYLDGFGAFPEDVQGVNIRLFNLNKIEELCLHTGFKLVEAKGVSGAQDHGLQSKIIRTFINLRPQLADHLIIKMRRLDH